MVTKMPLGALAFGLVRLGVTQAARVDVRFEGEGTTFHHIALKGQDHLPRARPMVELKRPFISCSSPVLLLVGFLDPETDGTMMDVKLLSDRAGTETRRCQCECPDFDGTIIAPLFAITREIPLAEATSEAMRSGSIHPLFHYRRLA
jgi:hypothetical protein